MELSHVLMSMDIMMSRHDCRSLAVFLYYVFCPAGLSTWDLTPDKSALPEVLNVAWASHEIIHDTTVDMLDWFEEQQQLSL